MPIECIGILKSGRTLAKTNAKTKLKVWNYIARYNQMWYLHQGRNRKKKKERYHNSAWEDLLTRFQFRIRKMLKVDLIFRVYGGGKKK